MEAKKNPGKDVHQQSFKFFLIGLAFSVSAAIVAFEWTTEKITYIACSFDFPLESSMELIPFNFQPIRETVISEKKIHPILQTLISVSSPEETSDEIPAIDISDYQFPDLNEKINLTNSPVEDTTEIIILAEIQPKPEGGYEQFYAQLSKNLKYPKQAVREGVDGKVFIEFVVDRKGQVNNMKVLKGIGSGCDEEALRVLALTGWEPGRQRGRPVNVRMVIPVFFKIQ